MARARENLIDLSLTPYYHCISRCVRRAFLCGNDRLTNKSFEHRRDWLVDRFKFLSTVFAIDICAYAVMSNHYHLVLRVDRDRVKSWSNDEVVTRWYQLTRGHVLIDRYRAGQLACDSEIATAEKIIAIWRRRLFDISWYMRHLNEFIARKANKEDDCTGRFWEGRFKSQALLDETALLTCMVYVDLNPIRAGIATELADSDFTSIQERIRSYQKETEKSRGCGESGAVNRQPSRLLVFGRHQDSDWLPLSLADYLELADWTVRRVNPDKSGCIASDKPPILQQLSVSEDEWVEYALNFRRIFGCFAGRASSLYHCAKCHHHRWYKGVG